MAVLPSASYSLTVRLQITNRPGMLGRVASAIGDAGGDIGPVDLVESGCDRIIRDLTVKARDSEHGQEIVNRLRKIPGVKIEIHNKVPVRTRDDLSMAYTPGVARVCLAIRDAEHRGRRDGRHRGPRPRRRRPGGGVTRDGRQGDALQGVRALRIVKKDLRKMRVVVTGVGAAGTATIEILQASGARDIVFAMANPNPEIQPEEAGKHVRVMATGRSDYANQINNVLCFPGFFRGLLDSRARTVNDEMAAVAEEVARAADATGVARRRRRRRHDLTAAP
jgi:malic enzyme